MDENKEKKIKKKRVGSLSEGLRNRSTPKYKSRVSTYDNVPNTEINYRLEEERNKLQSDLEKLTIQHNSLRRKYAQLKEENKILRIHGTQYRKLITVQDNLMESPTASRKNHFRWVKDKLNFMIKNRPDKDNDNVKKFVKEEPCFQNFVENLERSPKFPTLPKIIVECIEILENKPAFMQSIGLYRTPGNYAVIQKLRFEIDSNNYSGLYAQTDPNNITGIIKLLLRELRVPLVKQSTFKKHIKENFPRMSYFDQIQAMQNLIEELPNINQLTLQYLVIHLKKVSDEPMNDINSKSLSITMGACIFYESLMDANIMNFVKNPEILTNVCLEKMIDHHYDTFEKIR